MEKTRPFGRPTLATTDHADPPCCFRNRNELEVIRDQLLSPSPPFRSRRSAFFRPFLCIDPSIRAGPRVSATAQRRIVDKDGYSGMLGAYEKSSSSTNFMYLFT